MSWRKYIDFLNFFRQKKKTSQDHTLVSLVMVHYLATYIIGGARFTHLHMCVMHLQMMWANVSIHTRTHPFRLLNVINTGGHKCIHTHLTYMITPTDQRSIDLLYPSLLSTSGAVQQPNRYKKEGSQHYNH